MNYNFITQTICVFTWLTFERTNMKYVREFHIRVYINASLEVEAMNSLYHLFHPIQLDLLLVRKAIY